MGVVSVVLLVCVCCVVGVMLWILCSVYLRNKILLLFSAKIIHFNV